MVSNNNYKLKYNKNKKKERFQATRCCCKHCQVGLKVYITDSKKSLIGMWLCDNLIMGTQNYRWSKGFWTMRSKYANHSRFNNPHKLGGGGGIYMATWWARQCSLKILKTAFNWVQTFMRTCTIWICSSSRIIVKSPITNHLRDFVPDLEKYKVVQTHYV